MNHDFSSPASGADRIIPGAGGQRRSRWARALSSGAALALLGWHSSGLCACSWSLAPEPHDTPHTETARAPAPAPPALASAGATEDAKNATAPATASARKELHWTFQNGPFGPTDAVISVPVAAAERRFPVLVAFHGRGESVKGRRRGARGWLDDYALERALQRLEKPPLSSEDFEGFVSPDRLSRLNASLLTHPYAGLIIVCPFLPDVLKGQSAFREAEPLARFVVDTLLPRVYAKTPAIGTAETTGIDGVSLGGRAALLVGLSRPLAFGSVAGLQAALDVKEIPRLSEWAARALEQNPKLSLRLLTSDEDYFRDVNQQFSKALRGQGVRHELTEVVGTHSYRFNRGPGAYEMLLFQDRVLRGLPGL